MNEIINKFLLTGDKFMPETHLRDPNVGTYSACDSFIKHKQRIQRFLETGDANFIYKNELDKACFQHDMAYNKCKDLKKRTQSDKGLKEKAYKITIDPEKNGYEKVLAGMVYKFFNKKTEGSGIKNEIKENQQLAKERHKPLIRKFKKRKVYSSFKDNICGVDLADMQLISKINKGIRYL